MSDHLIYIGLFVACLIYALLLEVSKQRWKLISRLAWLSVIAGVAIVLLWVECFQC